MFCYALSYASSFLTQIILIFFLQLHVLLQIIITFNEKKSFLVKEAVLCNLSIPMKD